MARFVRIDIVALVILAATQQTYAKKVICIDGCNTPFVNNHEGYENANATVPPDVIQVGGNLQDCLANVADGDELIIIAHGSGTGTGFTWGGMTYTGFGGGAGQHPVPAGFAMLMNVTVKFCSCWSARDPDGEGGNTSLVDKIITAMGGADNGHTGSGFNDIATASANVGLTAGTQARADAAGDCLDNDPSYQNNPPANRPGTGGMGQPANQQSAAQAIVNACPGAGPAGNVTVTITYKTPVNELEAPQGGGVLGCECPNEPPFCGFGIASVQTGGDIPTVSEWGLIIMTLLLLTAGTIVFGRARRAKPVVA